MDIRYTLRMTKPQRASLFFSISLFFLITAPTLIFYSQGYRIDWTSKKITQTGGLYIKTIPSRTDVYLNSKFSKKTDMIFDSALIADLLPDSYHIRIQKEGFISWAKTLEVKPKQVTEVKDVILFPEQTTFQTELQNVVKVWPSPKGDKRIVQKMFPEQTTWDLVLWNPSHHEEKIITKEKSSGEITDVQWSDDASHIIVQTISDQGSRILIFNIQGNSKNPCTLVPCALDFAGKNIVKTSFAPGSSSQIIALRLSKESQELGTLHYLTKTSFQPLASHILAFAKNKENLLYLTHQGILWQKDISSNNEPVALNTTAYTIQQETAYKIFRAKDLIFLQEEEKLFRLNSQKEFEIVSSKARNLEISPDETILSYATDSGIVLLSLEMNSKKTMLDIGKNISDIAWIEQNYIAFTSANTIHITETDTRDSLNIATIGTFPNPTIFWNKESKTLTVFSEGLAYTSEKLIP